ncbi:MAG TPA: hypothetical protein VMS21_12405 [Methylomirabilota bacterium]|nr:hypothetical protein [Methylomirabilota bacterium]
MKANAIESNATRHGAKFTRVFDGRKQPIRGLCKRGDRYYARIVENGINQPPAVR